MKNKKIQNYKEELLNEKNQKINLIKSIKNGELSDIRNEMASELSFYDNHPSDTATELFDAEKAMALKVEQEKILDEINSALDNIEKGSYGKCKSCGKKISDERLEGLPYTDICVSCAKEKASLSEMKNRPIEEKVIGTPFMYEGRKENVSFDIEDSYQKVADFNSIKDTEDFDSSDKQYVEPIERISNEQYKDQL
ncbi:yteA family sporulation protein [Clostridium sediminicola]|uniref:TraR/DksA C4-type zinc finger protein n=1 Tax=Clostridium sediminicola TaxID=3114879 RepID=UPI0031F226AB